MRRAATAAIFAWALMGAGPSAAQSPEEWARLGARVHGGYGAFIPLGVRIGLDAAQRLKAAPRSLLVTYHDNPKAPCACFADGIALATVASVGQRSLVIAPEPAPDGSAAVILVRPKAGGAGLRYTIPMAALPRLAEMNRTMQELARHEAVMAADGLFTVEEAP
ncbi:MAG TPA: formylmethanofuran dehydrogenase subunit E family protein [Beijerinckiaceae bacterium]